MTMNFMWLDSNDKDDASSKISLNSQKFSFDQRGIGWRWNQKDTQKISIKTSPTHFKHSTSSHQMGLNISLSVRASAMMLIENH